MNKKEENNDNLKKPEPFAYKNWTELIKPTKIDVDKEEKKFTSNKKSTCRSTRSAPEDRPYADYGHYYCTSKSIRNQ